MNLFKALSEAPGHLRSLRKMTLGLCAAMAVSASIVACSQDQSNPVETSAPSLGSATDIQGTMPFASDERLVAAADDLAKSNEAALQAGPHDAVLEARVSHTKDVQGRHNAELLAKEGVIGTGVGLESDGTTSLVVFARHGNMKNIPRTMEDQKTRVEVIGDIKPLSGVYTGYYRPVPAGISIGNELENSAGTLGCAVNIGGRAYMLSNNHVMARQNAARIGEAIGQPGRYDNYGYATPQVATLSAFKPVQFNTTNSFDAAVAAYTTNGYASEISGYVPSHTTLQPQVGMYVKKTGRTTGLTHGQIAAVNVTIQVGYTGGTATFTNQIYIPGAFIQAGDSGSLLVTENGNYPVGLCFAGSSTASFANPIQPVLSYFGATVIGY